MERIADSMTRPAWSNVITSYSIHYTKLYDALATLLAALSGTTAGCGLSLDYDPPDEQALAVGRVRLQDLVIEIVGNA